MPVCQALPRRVPPFFNTPQQAARHRNNKRPRQSIRTLSGRGTSVCALPASNLRAGPQVLAARKTRSEFEGILRWMRGPALNAQIDDRLAGQLVQARRDHGPVTMHRRLLQAQ